MLVFGESILNDAVAIVLTTTIMESGGPDMADIGVFSQIGGGITRFFGVFFGSAGTFNTLLNIICFIQFYCSYRYLSRHDQCLGFEADRLVHEP